MYKNYELEDKKRDFRKDVFEKLKQHSKNDSLLVSHLEKFCHDKDGFWGGFRHLPSEPAIDSLFTTNLKITWTFPRVRHEILEFFISQKFKISSLQVHEPESDGAQQVDVPNLGGVLVPGVAYSKKGLRLGRGKGYYDKTLANYRGLKVGVGYEVQVFDEIPAAAHDLKVDYLITEKAIYAF